MEYGERPIAGQSG